MSRADERDHDYRLTDTDEATMRAAILRTLTSDEPSSDFHLIRAAVRSIGCTVTDMRLIELQWIENEIDEQRTASNDAGVEFFERMADDRNNTGRWWRWCP